MKRFERDFYSRLLRRALQQNSYEDCEVRVKNDSIYVYPSKEGMNSFCRAGETVYAFARAFNLFPITKSEPFGNEDGCRPYIVLVLN